MSDLRRGPGRPKKRKATPALLGVVKDVTTEYSTASEKFPPFRSMHEGYAVLLEELDEMWEAIKVNDRKEARREAVQVAAMAIRFLVDC